MKVRGLPRVYEDLTGRARSHLWQIRKLQKKQPEYTVALVIAVVSEGLSLLQGKSRWAVFRQLLRRRYSVSESVGRGLFHAVRDGLAHRYDTALIDTGNGKKIVVVVTWKKPHRHLCVEPRDWLHDGKERLGVWLDMDTMWQDLVAYLNALDDKLRRNSKLSGSVKRRGQELDDGYAVGRKKEPGESEDDRCKGVQEWKQSWQKFLNDRRINAG
jgi:hypothetical protein